MKMKKLTQKQVLDNLGKIFFLNYQIEQKKVAIPTELKQRLYRYEWLLHSNFENFRDNNDIQNFIIRIKELLFEIQTILLNIKKNK